MRAFHYVTPFARLEAIAQLGETEGAEIAIETLTALLADQQEPASLREVVAESLGALGTEAAIEALVAALDDPSADLRETAAWSLSEVEETPLAVKALTRAANEDLDTTVQWISMYALSSMAPEKSVALARRVLGRADRSWQMRLHQQAVSILGQDGARNDLPILLDRGRAKWPREVRRAASQAALKLLDREDEDWSDKHEDRLARVLLDALQDPDLRVRQFALSMLGRLGSEEALGGLKRFGAENEVIRPDLSELARDAATLMRWALWSDDEPDDEEADEDLEALTQRLEELEERLEHLEEWR